MTESFLTGVMWMLLSATAMSFVGFLGKLLFEEMSLTALIFWRFFTAFIICFIGLACLGRLKHFRFEHVKMNFIRSFFFLTSQMCFYYYIGHETLLNGVTLLNTGPLFIPIMEWIATRSRIGWSSWIGLIVSFIGVLLLLQPDVGIFSMISLIGLLAGVCQAISQVLFGLNAKKENAEIGILTLMGIASCLALFPYLLVEVPSFNADANLKVAIWLMGALSVVSILNQSARGVAYKHGTPSRLSPFLYFSVILAGIFDWAVFGNAPNLLSVLGAILVVSGGLLKIYLRHKILQRKR